MIGRGSQIKAFVLDTSVTMAWCFEDEATRQRRRCLTVWGGGDVAVVPAVWRLELANVLLASERRRISEAQSMRFVQLLDELPIQVDLATINIGVVVRTGRAHTLSAYDAAYLVLCERSALPLVTLDQGSGPQACRTAGVPVSAWYVS